MRILVIIILSGFSAYSVFGYTLIHHTLGKNPTKYSIKKMAILSTDIDVYEVFPGGAPQLFFRWSQMANTNFDKQLKSVFSSAYEVRYPEFAENVAKEKHLENCEILKLVLRSAYQHTNTDSTQDDDWSHMRLRFDYSVGQSLHELKDLGFDAALLVIGYQTATFKSSQQRQISVRRSQVIFYPLTFIVGLFDTRSGNLLRFHAEKVFDLDVRNSGEVGALIRGELKDMLSIGSE